MGVAEVVGFAGLARIPFLLLQFAGEQAPSVVGQGKAEVSGTWVLPILRVGQAGQQSDRHRRAIRRNTGIFSLRRGFLRRSRGSVS